CVLLCPFFFFSGRRRHTRFSRDWSSDVCSSDLCFGPFLRLIDLGIVFCLLAGAALHIFLPIPERRLQRRVGLPRAVRDGVLHARSEERRVGKECRVRWGRGQEKRRRETYVREKC